LHELGLASEILEVVLSEAERNTARQVTAVTLRVGVLRAIEPEHLSFLFAHLARGTAADGARIEIRDDPVRVGCPACGVSEAHSIVRECPRCGRGGVVATGGDVLEIVALEIDA
jgi:hydrogenase nickel incorporation protein HypA/HybF